MAVAYNAVIVLAQPSCTPHGYLKQGHAPESYPSSHEPTQAALSESACGHPLLEFVGRKGSCITGWPLEQQRPPLAPARSKWPGTEAVPSL